jgi:hypothetical protein
MIGAEPRVCFRCGAIDVKGKNVGRHGTAGFVPEVCVDAVELGVEILFTQQALIREHGFDSQTAGFTERKLTKDFLIKSDDTFARAKELNDFREISGQCPGPAECVDFARKWSG